ncbi:hypothetical protein AALK94_14335 [Bacteroides faecichinchillae]|uniref:Uncharacterized protein n=1 Tax=Bacteroides faecichinchillae TaxID=871325 RepID=A0A1M5BWH7_9BACE|nr:hypothetical protein [Bacteroides faecichinchillae]THG65694.1 hypothetical protein E5981_11760 [Bacteroides faecichinchillae]SHF46720.1 hypothetical protein SAMN05444349_1216 [Bacteroides faecichinchillae]
MKISKKSTNHVCGCCKRTLPLEAFYLDKKTNLPRNYCKECRKSASRNHRKVEKQTFVNKRETVYPVITLIKDPNVRKELIRHALETVAASIQRKRQKLLAVEAEQDI